MVQGRAASELARAARARAGRAAEGSWAQRRDGGREDVPRVGTRGKGDMIKKLEWWRRRTRGRRRGRVGRGLKDVSFELAHACLQDPVGGRGRTPGMRSQRMRPVVGV